MLRLAEFALLLAPLAAFLAWRLLDATGGPSNRLLVSAAIAVAVIAAVLFFVVGSEGLRRGSAYVPASLQDGRIVPGHAASQ
jgi:peptidoglycan/LPS O-acetylase OafA/YrhL